MSGMVASCAEPANTISDISTATVMSMPLLAMATPVTRPQAAMPTAMPVMSCAPRRNSGSRHKVRKSDEAGVGEEDTAPGLSGRLGGPTYSLAALALSPVLARLEDGTPWGATVSTLFSRM